MVKCVSVKRPCPQNPLSRPFLATSLCLITLVPACLLGLTKTKVTSNSLIQPHLITNWARPHTPICGVGGGHQQYVVLRAPKILDPALAPCLLLSP